MSSRDHLPFQLLLCIGRLDCIAWGSLPRWETRARVTSISRPNASRETRVLRNLCVPHVERERAGEGVELEKWGVKDQICFSSLPHIRYPQ